MAFLGRGDMPSINMNNNDGENTFHSSFHRRHRLYGGVYYYVPLDNTYVLMQMFTTFIILIFGVIAFVTTYKSSIIDPIEGVKKAFINTHLIIIGILLAITLIINFFSEDETSIIKRLIITACISVLIMFGFVIKKLEFDSLYTTAKFEQMYEEQNIEETGKKRIDIGLGGASLKTEKQYYVDECVKLYNIFKTKATSTLGIHLLLNALLVYQIIKIFKIQNKKQQLNKDDLILFDEEQNIKM